MGVKGSPLVFLVFSSRPRTHSTNGTLLEALALLQAPVEATVTMESSGALLKYGAAAATCAAVAAAGTAAYRAQSRCDQYAPRVSLRHDASSLDFLHGWVQPSLSVGSQEAKP